MLIRVFVLMLVVLAIGPFAAASARAQQADYTGVYDTTGAAANGRRYSGVTDVARNPDGSYAVEQSVGGQMLHGTGYDEGKQGLRVVFSEFGLEAIYVRQPDGRLEGVWGNIGGPFDSTETLIPR